MSPTPQDLFAQREKRFNDIVALRKPDRVPVMPLYVHNFATRIKGISNRDAGHDHMARWQSTKEATVRFGWNFAPTNDVLASDLLRGHRQPAVALGRRRPGRQRAASVGRA